MKLSGNKVLVTGGASGIGWAIARRFLDAGSQVIICGRRADKLLEAKSQHPGVHTMVADVSTAAEREELFEHVTREHPDLNVLVNNAGVQHRGRITEGMQDWSWHQQEIAINLEAPIHLAMLFVPHLRKQRSPVVINVTSGLAFAPLPGAAIYSATKAALHSFTLSMRVQLDGTGIEVVEVIPPAVNTDLGGAGLHTFGVPLEEFADAVFAGLSEGRPEVAYGTAEQARVANREQLDASLQRMAALLH